MKQTDKYGLNLPELTDPADITPLNENFVKIDKELNNFYELFLDGDFHPSFDLSAKEKTVDVTEYLDYSALLDATYNNKIIRMWFLESKNTAMCYALLTATFSSGSNVYFCGLVSMPYYNSSYAEFVLVYNKSEETFSLRHYGNFPQRFLDNVKGQVVQSVNGVAPDENGNVKVAAERKAKAMDLSNFDAGSFTVTWEDDTVSEFAVTFDESGRPTVINDGESDFTITWPAEES